MPREFQCQCIVDAVFGNPSVWTLGNIVRAHCSQVFEKYGPHLNTFLLESSVKTQATKLDGQRYLGMNSQCLSGYSTSARFSCSQELSAKMKPIYHQKFLMINLDCYCGLLKASPDVAKCTFCGDKVMKLIEQSGKQGEVVPQLL